MADALIRAFARVRVGLAFACWITVDLGTVAWAANLADPTLPPPGYGAAQHPGEAGLPDVTPEPVRLQMIASDGVRRLAVVNGHRVRPGDAITLDGKSVTVVEIDANAVVLDRGGRRQQVELIPRGGLTPHCAADSSDRARCRSDVPGAQR